VTTISWFIPGAPKAKGRPKFCVRGKFAQVYTPAKTREYEEAVRLFSAPHAPLEPLRGPITMDLTFHMPRPKSLSKKIKVHIKKPDIDNLIKSVLDPLNKLFYHDDSQIIRITASKVYATGDAGIQVILDQVEKTIERKL
jgi:Holliday junction resolvase RusA-like endonuclease